MPIAYIQGDATSPQATGAKLIVHVCNDRGGWGAGFVVAISKRWARPEQMYRRWHHDAEPVRDAEPGRIVMTSGRFGLGESQLVMVQSDLAVVNMIAQEGMRGGSKGPPIRYDSLDATLGHVHGYADSFQASVHMPRIGCGLAGGKWEEVEPIIRRRLGDVSVYVYDFG
jgi:O-acetyl-ADP-ribose deacetylase (regulator of RNase III)